LPCPSVQVRRASGSLFFGLQNTGLTSTPTKSSMCKVANRSLRFRCAVRVVLFRERQGSWPAIDGLRF
jgi:hypothetical protein